MSNRKKLKDLTIRDNFMFAAVMMQGDNCKLFLEMLLGIEIERIEISYEKSIENRCLENFELGLGDDSRSIFLSTKGKNSKEIPETLEQFLQFVRNDTASNDMETTNSYVKQLQNTIRSIKENREMECRYQFAGDMLVREFKKGKKEGRMEGILETQKNNILELLEDLGRVSNSTYERIMSENREEVLKTMLKVAVKADSLEQFENLISNL